MSKLQRELIIIPGFDKRSDESSKNYGVHGCEVVFYLHGPRKTKTVQLKLSTDWLPLNVQKERMGVDVADTVSYPEVCQVVVSEQPMGMDLGYHSPRPKYKGQPRRNCDLSKRGYCYYDGSGLAADGVRDVLLKEGSEGVWRELEEYYNSTFPTKEAL